MKKMSFVRSSLVTHEGTPQQRLARFVEDARRANPLRQDWDSETWMVRTGLPATHQQRQGVRFARRVEPEGDYVPFAEPLAGFARALCCVPRSIPFEVRAGELHKLLRALRCLDAHLASSGKPVYKLRSQDLQSAQELAEARYAPGTSNNVGIALSFVADVINRLGLTDARLGFEPNLLDASESEEGGRMMTPDEVSAIAHLSGRYDELLPFDQIRQCAVDLMMCCGFRVSEVCTLPRDTWYEARILDEDGSPVLLPDGSPEVRYGLRYWPEKGGSGATMLKAIPTSMVPVARRAVERALRATEGYHVVARHQLETGRTTLGSEWDALPRDHVLSRRELAAMLGIRTLSVREFLEGRQIPHWEQKMPKRGGGERKTLVARKGDVEDALFATSYHEDCRPDEPEDILLPDLLFVVAKSMQKNSGLRGTAWVLQYEAMYTYLHSKKGRQSIFERYGYTSRGIPIDIQTHLFRHTMNTLAMQGGLHPLALARWMGRRLPRANARYDHEDSDEIAEEAAGLLAASDGKPRPEVKNFEPLSPSESVVREDRSAHVTEYGACFHSYADPPCASLAEWAEGGGVLLARPPAAELTRQIEEIESLLAAAETELDAGTYGAANWVAAHERTLAALGRIEVADAGEGAP